MGRVAGKKHEKPRVYLAPEQKTALVRRYNEALASNEFLTQAQLGAEFGITQVAASKILRAAGVRTRSREEACPTRIDPQEAARIYLENPRMTIEEVGELYDVGYTATRDQLLKAGVPLRTSTDYARYACNRNFFAEVNPTTAYFAGFIAADGYITKSGLSVNFGLHPKDAVILTNLKAACGSEHPIVVRPNNTGRLYSWLSVCSIDWVRDLERHYNIVNAKSLILRPPNLTDEGLIWHFIRGYFDGDGHASLAGLVHIITGSQAFMGWLKEILGEPGHIQEHEWLNEDKETYICGYGAWWSKLADAKRIALKMYADSTPAIRLERKFLRLQRHFGPGPQTAPEEFEDVLELDDADDAPELERIKGA